MRKHIIKLSIKTERQLNEIHRCFKCNKETMYRHLYFYVDESNIAITKNSKGICEECKNINHNDQPTTSTHRYLNDW